MIHYELAAGVGVTITKDVGPPKRVIISANIGDLDGLYLKLNQVIHQHVINGSPHFDGGVVLKSGQRLVFDGA
jgi:hypothetical protein